MEMVVQKYGGTSIGRAERMLNVAKIVKMTIDGGEQPTVVLSAMSSAIKKEGTTSRLIEAASEALKGGAYYKIIDLLAEHHINTAREAITDERICAAVEEDINRELKKLKSFLDAIGVIGEISARSDDVIVSIGEKLSARIFTGILNSQGIDAEYVNLESVVDKEFKEVDRDFCLYLQKKLAGIITDLGPKVGVVTGYFGFAPGGIIKSVGRGYTDFTAALIAAGLKAKELQVWKEVDGIFSTDPRKVEAAVVLDTITPEEAMELTYFGSEVIHPFTMEQVRRALVPVRIKNTFDANVPGTLIDPNVTADPEKRGATAVTVKKGISVINVNSNRMLMAYGFMSRIFDIFNRHEIVIDLISTSEVSVSLTIDDDHNLEGAITELEKLGDVFVKKNMAILSLVGTGMRQTSGMAGDMFGRLGEANINIEAISQGASEINISTVINGSDADTALKAVHKMLEK